MVTSATPASTMLKMFSGALRGLSEGAAVRSSLAFMRHSCSWSERAWRERCSRRCGAARSAGCLLREEVYELKVLELGGQGGGELGPVGSLAHLAGHLEEGLHVSRERHISPAEGHYWALYLRAVLDFYQGKIPRCHRGYHRRPEQRSRQLIVARRVVEEYKLLPPDLRQLRRSLLREAMLRIHHQHELVLVKRHAFYLWVAHCPRQAEMYLLL